VTLAAPGGGGTILIDPASLRRCATVLNEVASDVTSTASCLRGTGLPTMPSPIAGQVTSGIQEVAGLLAGFESLHDSAAELKARATWADVANALAAGYPLSGSLLREFVHGHEDGSLMRYATPEDKRLAGTWVGGAYKHTFDTDPRKLVELSRILHGSGYDPDFAESFVRAFGGVKLVRVPRVIQAMQWPTALQQSTSPFADRKLALDLQYDGYELKDDPESLLSGFAMTLAVATSAADTSRRSSRLQGEEDDIAQSDDHWAVTQLLQSGPPAGRRFLGEVFRHQVVPLVQQDTTDYMLGGVPFSEYPIGDLQGDPKEVLLHAIARNGAASADALTTKLPDTVFFQTPYGPVETDDPIKVLLGGHWHDGGDAVGDVYTSATDHLQGIAGKPDGPDAAYHPTAEQRQALAQANGITLEVIDQTLHGPQELDGVTGALTHDLATHHVDDLYQSAGNLMQGSDPGFVDHETGDLRLYLPAERDLLAHLADDPELEKPLLNAAAHYQAQLILDHTGEAPSASNLHWVNNVAAFNATLMSAHDMNIQGGFDAANAKHELVFKFVHGTADLVATAAHVEVPGSGFLIDSSIDVIDDATKPDEALVNLQQGQQDGLVMNTFNATVAAGYYDHHLIHHAPERLLQDGHLRAYGSLQDPGDVAAYHEWMYDGDETGRYVLPPRDHATSVIVQASRILDHGD
jgi:hypothetical protein